MNWNGQIDADNFTGRVIQFYTSWRVWLSAVIVAVLYFSPLVLSADTYHVGWFAGMIAYILGDRLAGDLTETEGSA